MHDAINRRRQQRDGWLPEKGIRAEEVLRSVEATEGAQGLREEVRAALTHLQRQQEITLQSEPRDELGLQVLEATTRQRRPEGQAARQPPTTAEENGAPAAPAWLQDRPDDDEGREADEARAPDQPPKRRRSYRPDYLMRQMGASAPDLARELLEALGPCPPLTQPGPQGQTIPAAEEDDETAQHDTQDGQHGMELEGAAAPSEPQTQPDMEPSRPPRTQPGTQSQVGSAAMALDETAQHGMGDEQYSMELDGAAAPSGPQAQPDAGPSRPPAQPDGQRRARQDGGEAGSKGKSAAPRSEKRDKYAARAK